MSDNFFDRGPTDFRSAPRYGTAFSPTGFSTGLPADVFASAPAYAQAGVYVVGADLGDRGPFHALSGDVLSGAAPAADGSVHVPVMLSEILGFFEEYRRGLFLDATWGCGGYGGALLDRKPGIRLVAFDKDPEVSKFAPDEFDRRFRQKGGRAIFIESCFGRMTEALSERGLGGCSFNGIVFDLGLSSAQLASKRGFSFQRADAPLDMRFSGKGVTAADWLNDADEDEIARVLRDYGEERQAGRIAKAVVVARKAKAVRTVGDLVSAVDGCVFRRPGRIHPATKTFMAIRIHINRELEVLSSAIDRALGLLAPGGRLAVVGFHSLEDRIVKTAFSRAAGIETRPSRHLPPSLAPSEGGPERASRRAEYRLITKGVVRPSRAEVLSNPRSRSARLRVVEKTADLDAGKIWEGGEAARILFDGVAAGLGEGVDRFDISGPSGVSGPFGVAALFGLFERISVASMRSTVERLNGPRFGIPATARAL